MSKSLERLVLEKLKTEKEPEKARVTFFISKKVKAGLAKWCKEHELKESPALEEIIKQVIPTKYFD